VSNKEGDNKAREGKKGRNWLILKMKEEI